MKDGKLESKYIIKKTNGKKVDDFAKYFLLRYDKNDTWGKLSRQAIRFFARRLRQDMPELSESLLKEMDNISLRYMEMEHDFKKVNKAISRMKTPDR